MYAAIVGTIDFQCPHCGTLCRARLLHISMRVRCGGCRRKYLVGIRLLRPVPGAARRMHRDSVPPLDPVLEGAWCPPLDRPPAPAELGYVEAQFGGRMQSRTSPLNSVEDISADLIRRAPDEDLPADLPDDLLDP